MTRRLDAETVRRAAHRKWADILASCGIERAYLTGKEGPCPICRDGKDRFVFDDKDGRGSYICRQCGAGDGFKLLQAVLGIGFSEALGMVAERAGEARAITIRQGRDIEEATKEAKAIWARSRPIEQVPAVAAWWFLRTGELPPSAELRATPRLKYGREGEFPAMVARIKDGAGVSYSLHRTYLDETGQKAPVESPRKVMDIQMRENSAVRLYPAGAELGVAEGIETAESCRLLFGVPTWALLNARNMRSFVPPPEVRRLIIFGEMDGSYTGQAAAFDLAQRLWVKRKNWDPELYVEVRIHGMTVDPNAWDRDWNDLWRSKRVIEPAPPQPIDRSAA